MTRKAIPPRVDDEQKYWSHPPPEPSPRCVYWQERIRAGWRPNRRIGGLGYAGACPFFGVYLWEYLHVLSPLLWEMESTPTPPPSSPAR